MNEMKVASWLMWGLAGVAVVPAAGPAFAATIVQWDFNSPVDDGSTSTGTYSPSTDNAAGSPSIALIGGVTPSSFGNGFVTADSSSLSAPDNRSSDPATSDDSAVLAQDFPAQGTGDETAGYQLDLDLSGYENVGLSFDYLVQAASSRYYQLQYSVGGGAYTDFALLDTASIETWVNGQTYAFGSLLDQQSDVSLRLVATFAPGTSSYGSKRLAYNPTGSDQVRLDMVTLTGTPIPEPASLGLLLGAGCLLRRRSRHG